MSDKAMGVFLLVGGAMALIGGATGEVIFTGIAAGQCLGFAILIFRGEL